MTATSIIESRRGPLSARLAPVLPALLIALLLAGCGQKGPLWVPGHAKNTPWPMTPAGTEPATPAPATPAPASGEGKAATPQGAQGTQVTQ